MGDRGDPAADVQRLLRQAGILPSQPAPKPPRSLWARFLSWVLPRVLITLACLGAVLGAAAHWSTSTGDRILSSTTPSRQLPRLGAVDARIGVVEAFRSPARAALLPIGWERIPFEWRELQKSGADTWNSFAAVSDRVINDERRRGRSVVGLLINTPDWAAAHVSQHGSSPPKGLYLPYNDPHNYWARFVGLVVRRYAGRIDDWIIWNEVNIRSGHWKTWSGSYADYAQLVKVAYQAARMANPAARIVLAGDPYWYDHGAYFSQLLHRLIAEPDARANNFFFDVANLHLYSRSTDMITVVARYRDLMHEAGIGKPIWIGETNAIPFDDNVRRYPRGAFRASMDDQASFIIQAFALDLVMGVQRFEVNRMLDGADFRSGGEPFGLVRNDGTVRPAYYAYRTAAALFAGTTGGSIAISKASGVYTVTLRRPGGRVLVLWNQHPQPANMWLRLAASARIYDKFGQQLPVVRRAGLALVRLAGAKGNTNNSDPRDYVIGGSPVLVVE